MKRFIAAMLTICVCAFGGCMSVPDEDDTAWLRDAIDEQPQDAVIKVANDTRRSLMCDHLLKTLEAQRAFDVKNPKGQSSVVVAICRDTSGKIPDEFWQVRTREDVRKACETYDGKQGFGRFWRTIWRNLPYYETNPTEPIDSTWECRSLSGSKWEQSVEAAEEAYKPIDQARDSLVIFLLTGVVAPQLLAAELPGLLPVLARLCIQANVYCNDESSGVGPGDPLQPVEPGLPADGDSP
jgi:hypothetical protein